MRIVEFLLFVPWLSEYVSVFCLFVFKKQYFLPVTNFKIKTLNQNVKVKITVAVNFSGESHLSTQCLIMTIVTASISILAIEYLVAQV